MECMIGIKFENFVMIAADMTCAQSILVMKEDENKLYKLSDKLVMGVCGEAGDTTQFAEYICKNVQLYKMRNGYELSPTAATHFTRRVLADALRSQGAYQVNLILAGYDEHTGPQLYFMDYLASMLEVDYCAHGFGGFFSIAIMDCLHSNDFSHDDAYELMKQCIAEVHKRLIINLPNFKVQVIDKDGIKEMPNINSKSFT